MARGGSALTAVAAAHVAVTSPDARIILPVLGAALILFAIFGSSHLRIEFNRPDQTVTITRTPVCPIPGSVPSTRGRTRDLATFTFAYVERTMAGFQEMPLYNLALAKRNIPAMMLDASRTPPLVVTDESVRMVLSTSGRLRRTHAISLAEAVNQWLGATAPAQRFD